jgi:hypothetical protein
VADIWIETDQGNGWELYQEGGAEIAAEQVRQWLSTFSYRYRARAFLNGVLVGQAASVCGNPVGRAAVDDRALNLKPRATLT